MLERKLDWRRPHIDRYEDYYDGHHRLLFASSKFREAFGDMFSAFADNWCDLVVDAAVERLAVEGFRFGKDTAADDEAWAIWQANGLDAESIIGHTDGVKCGEFYALVTPTDGSSPPIITIEHPAEAIVELNPVRPRERLAGLKKYVGEDDRLYAYVYLPDRVFKFAQDGTSKAAKAAENLPSRFWMPANAILATEPGWQLDDVVEHRLGAVPLVGFYNRPGRQRRRGDGRRHGRSDIHTTIAVQDFINKILADAVVASEYMAYPQRWATGVSPQIDEETGKELENSDFVAAVSRLWIEGDDKAKFGSFDTADLTKYVALIELGVQHIAAQTRTPPHYLLGSSGNFPSGESLKATETGLVARVKRKQKDYGESWEETLRLSFRAQGDEKRGRELRSETIWRDPESRTEGERVDALTKMATLGVPNVVLWEKWGVSPTEIERWKQLAAEQRAQDALSTFGFNPAPNATNTPPAPAGAGV